MRQIIEYERSLFGDISVDESLFEDDFGSGALLVQ